MTRQRHENPQVQKRVDALIRIINDRPGITAGQIITEMIDRNQMTFHRVTLRRYLRALVRLNAITRNGIWDYKYYPVGKAFRIPDTQPWNTYMRMTDRKYRRRHYDPKRKT